MAKVTRNFLFAGFLILGLIPPILCIIFPPTLGLLEKTDKNGLNTTLNNWYNTREHPSVDLPEKVIASLQKENLKNDELFDSLFITNWQPLKELLNIQLKQKNNETASAGLYAAKGTHIHTAFFSNSNFNIPLNKKMLVNDYYLLLNVSGKTHSKKITITK